MLNLSFSELIILIPAILLGLTIHELAHAFVALKLGDDTPKKLGRLTLNPIKHIDPIGFILLLIAGFGWAKPVMINRNNLKHPNRDDILISLAGPFSNLLFSILLALILKIVIIVNPHISQNTIESVFSVFIVFLGINIALGVFNLLPIPPLDGSHMILNLLSLKSSSISRTYFKYGSFALLAIILLERIIRINLLPVGRVVQFITMGLLKLVSLI